MDLAIFRAIYRGGEFMQIFLVLVMTTFIGINSAHGSSCAAKVHIVSEYIQWKKDYQKFLSRYDDMSSSERFKQGKKSIKVVLEKMQALAEKALIPLPESTFIHAKGLVNEIEAGRMARTTAIPILKSSLKALEASMEEMITKAQWRNPSCNIT
jgi:hypothetical protein